MKLEVRALCIEGVKILRPQGVRDERGALTETYNARALREAGIEAEFVQDNCVLSYKPATLRGLHFQVAPHAQCKLVRVIRGAIFDVAVDLRTSSPSYGRYASFTVSAASGDQVFVPAGFAHGFLTLEPDTEVAVKLSAHQEPTAACGIAWNDPEIRIDWPIDTDVVIVSAKDAQWPPFSKLTSPFTS